MPDVEDFYSKTENEIGYLKDLIREKYNLISESLKYTSSNNKQNELKSEGELITHYISEINQVNFEK